MSCAVRREYEFFRADGNGRLNANAHPNSVYRIPVWIPDHREVVIIGKTGEQKICRVIPEIEAWTGLNQGLHDH
jgi:hypothetical protein